jgi:hypothetical protein
MSTNEELKLVFEEPVQKKKAPKQRIISPISTMIHQRGLISLQINASQSLKR